MKGSKIGKKSIGEKKEDENVRRTEHKISSSHLPQKPSFTVPEGPLSSTLRECSKRYLF